MGKRSKAKEPDPLARVQPWAAGAAGGFIAGLGQFCATNLADFLGHLISKDWLFAMSLFGIFLFGTGILMGAGAIVAYFLQSRTQNRWAMFAVGIIATSIGTTALPGIKYVLKKLTLAPISVSYAASQPNCEQANFTFLSGLRDFFGLADGYHVVAGSFRRYQDALALANRINAEDPSLSAFVGERMPCNDYYPVIVGSSYAALFEAKKTLNKALKLDSVPGAFISNRDPN
jgi:hypothetical protein